MNKTIKVHSVTLLLLDGFIALLLSIILTWRFNAPPSTPSSSAVLTKAQEFLLSLLFETDPAPWVVFLFLTALAVYTVIRIKRNIQRLLASPRVHLTYITVGLSFFFLLVIPFIIVPTLFYPHVSLDEPANSLKITSNLRETNNPLRRIGRFFRAFTGRGCSYENLSWSETGDVLYFFNENCGAEYFSYDLRTHALSQKSYLPANLSLSTATEEALRFPDFIGTNYTINNFPSPSGEWTALLITYINFDRLQDIILVRSEDVKLLE